MKKFKIMKRAMILKINNERHSRIIGIISIGIALVMVFLLTGCQEAITDMLEGQEKLQDQTGNEGDVAMELHDTKPYGEAPPIDLNLPENLETATFGMG